MGFNVKKAAKSAAGAVKSGTGFNSYNPKDWNLKTIGGNILTGGMYGQAKGLGNIMGFEDKIARPDLPEYQNLDPQITQAQDKLKSMQDEAKKKEDAYLASLPGKAEESQRAVDAQLASLIDQTGFVTGLQKQQIGESMAGQGVLRSGQTALRLGSAELAKQGAIGSATAQAEQQKAGIRDQVKQAQQQVLDKRRATEQQIAQNELNALQDQKFQIERQKIMDQTQQFLGNLDIDSSQKAAMMGLFAGLGGIGGLAAGYYGKQAMQPGTDYSNNNPNVGLNVAGYNNPNTQGQTSYVNQTPQPTLGNYYRPIGLNAGGYNQPVQIGYVK